MPSLQTILFSRKAVRIGLTALLLSVSLPLAGCRLIGATLSAAIALTPIKLMFACLPEGTKIDTPRGPQPVESLRAGSVVTGYDGAPVRVLQIHGYLEDAQNSEFYEISFSNGASVDLCSMHRIGGVRAKDLAVGTVVSGGGTVTAITTYRGVARSYDLLTDDAGYRIGGVPVNSMIEEMYEAGRSGGPRESRAPRPVQ